MKTSFVKSLLRTLVALAAMAVVGSASASRIVRPGEIPSYPLLPTTSAGNVFSFTFNVVGNERWYVDPVIAVGYDYAVAGATSPTFQSVLLPTVAGSHYQLWNMSSGSAVSLGALDAGTVLNFGTGGASAFRVTGIAESAMLDPSNTQAFVTGLTVDQRRHGQHDADVDHCGGPRAVELCADVVGRGRAGPCQAPARCSPLKRLACRH
ncbi:hypothetical protein ACVBEH_04630 [Roseateles sp. GG27B]